MLLEQYVLNMSNREWFLPTCVAWLLHSIPSIVFTNEPGRPRLHIPEQSLVMLRETLSKASEFIMFLFS